MRSDDEEALAMKAVCLGEAVPCAVFAWTEFGLTLHPLVIQAEIRNVNVSFLAL